MREILKNLRKQKNLSQVELAKMLNVHQTAVSQWEQGRTNPDMQIIIRLSKLFGVSTDYLLGNDDEKINSIQNETLLSPKNKKLLDTTLDLSDDDLKKVIEYAELLKLKGNQ